MEYDLYTIIGGANVYTDFAMLKFKLTIIFLGTVGFSAHRDGR